MLRKRTICGAGLLAMAIMAACWRTPSARLMIPEMSINTLT